MFFLIGSLSSIVLELEILVPVIFTELTVASHNITQLLGYVPWNHVSHEHHYPLIMQSLLYKQQI